jgi:hypothetical protein
VAKRIPTKTSFGCPWRGALYVVVTNDSGDVF